jgi:hypothetical protein
MFTFVRRFGALSVAQDHGVPRLPYPVTPCPSIGLFSTHFADKLPAVHMASVGDLNAADVLTVAAPLAILRKIDPAVWTPEFPLIVFSRLHRGLLVQRDRDFLWDTFAVPVFEYLLDRNGRLLALECEAHDGLHLSTEDEDLPGNIVREACACGKSTSRLLGTEDIIEESIALSAFKQEWRNWQTHQT